MSKNSTRRKKKLNTNTKGNSERLLLFAILALGVVGLTISYSSRSGDSNTERASLIDSTQSDGKVKADHMIIQLNQRGAAKEESDKPAQF